MSSVEHRQHKRLNNCASTLYQPTRERERRMRRFKRPGYAQRLPVGYRATREERFATWRAALSTSAMV